ncbi:LCP family protein, partial [Gardnerella swidsinskii]|nr:LCP family protein [Gardnerella swidsinskii]
DSFSGKEPFNILLLGTDTGAFGRKEVRGNSDTMIIVTVNPAKKKLSLMSIPRDTMARMIGTESFSVHKINAAYNIGGAK